MRGFALFLLDQESSGNHCKLQKKQREVDSSMDIVKRSHFYQKCIFAVKGGLKPAVKTLLSGEKMKRPNGPKSLGWRRCEGQKLKGAVLAEVRTFQRVGSHVAVRNPTQAPRLPGSVFTRLADELSVAPLLHGTTDRLSEELAAKKKNSLASHQPGFHLRFVHERPGIGGSLHRVISESCGLKFRFALTL